MCTTNYWCSIIIISIILMAALSLTTLVDVHLSRKAQSESERQLNEFRKEAYKAKKDIEVLESFAEFESEKRGSRRRRHAEDLFDADTFDDATATGKFEAQAIQTNRQPDICKARNCAGGICRAESSKHCSKKLNNFLGNLRMVRKNMPREISLEESEPENNAANRRQNGEEAGEKSVMQNEAQADEEEEQEEEEAVGEKSLRKEKSPKQNLEKLSNDREKRLKPKKGNQNQLQYRWSPNAAKSKFRNLKEHTSFVKENQMCSDLSSCQQCSRNKEKDVVTNPCKTQKEPSPVESYKNIQFSQEPEKAQAVANDFNSFHSKYQQKVQADAADEDNEEDDELFHVANLKLAPYKRKNAVNQYKFKPPAVEKSQEQKTCPLGLNDQLEVSKNNLSHEANYKLSKAEQNAAENKKYPSWKWGLSKRSHPFNAMHEIKLKTSQRLMKKGYGASLPSYALAEMRRGFLIDNKLKQKEKEIFQSNNRKYKYFDESDNSENNFGETKTELEDLPEMSVEPDLEPLPVNEWSKTRHKRISSAKSRHKRELKRFKGKDAIKAFRDAKSFKTESLENKNIKAKALRPKIFENSIAKNKMFKAKLHAKRKFPKAVLKLINTAKCTKIKKFRKAFKPEKKLNRQIISTQIVAEPLNKTSKPLHYEKHTLHNVSNFKLLPAFCSLENKSETLKSKNYNKNEKAVSRLKRSLLFPTLEQRLISNKREGIEKSSDLRQSFQKLERKNSFNPYQTIFLKIYQKLHGDLKLRRHRRVLNQTYKKPDKVRRKSSLSSKAYVKNSAGHQNLIGRRGATMIMNTAIQFRKRVANLVQESLKYLTSFRKPSSTKSRKAFTTESLVSNSSKALQLNQNQSSEANQNSVAGQLNLPDKSFKVEHAKLEIKVFEYSRKTNASHVKSSKNFDLKNKAQYPAKGLKRRRRSLVTSLQDHPANSHVKKRSAFMTYGDFYKPASKAAAPMKIPTKLDFNIDNSQKLSNADVVPARQKTNYGNYYYDAFNTKQFDNLNYNPHEKKFDNLQFDNVWLENEPEDGNFKQKRFLNAEAATADATTKPHNFRMPFKRNYALKSHLFQSTPTRLPLKVQLLKDKYLKDLQNFNENYKFKANNRIWSKTNPNAKTNISDYSEKLGLEMHNEILNCKAFASLEDFIKSLPKNLTQPLPNDNSTAEKIEMDLNTLSVSPELTTTMRPLVLETTDNCTPKTQEERVDEQNEAATTSTTTESCEPDLEPTSEFQPYPNEESEESSFKPLEENNCAENVTTTITTDRDDVKLNISIKAHVHGNPKNQNYCGNCSINVMPGLLADRLRRDLNISPLEKIPAPFLRMGCQETQEEDKEDLTDFISGKFSSKAVKDILSAVQANPLLRVLWPSLSPSRKFETSYQQNFYAIRNQQNEPLLRNSEKLFVQAMSAVNAIVEQQARSRLCVPLRADLQDFYDMVVQSRQQQDLVRKKRENKNAPQKQDFSYQLHLLDPSRIEEKTKIVKKLLKQYDELPKEDQQQVAVVRDDLLKNLIALRQLQDNEERQGNELREQRENDWAASDEQTLKNLQSQYSAEFLKLLKTAELYREIKTD